MVEFKWAASVKFRTLVAFDAIKGVREAREKHYSLAFHKNTKPPEKSIALIEKRQCEPREWLPGLSKPSQRAT